MAVKECVIESVFGIKQLMSLVLVKLQSFPINDSEKSVAEYGFIFRL